MQEKLFSAVKAVVFPHVGVVAVAATFPETQLLAPRKPNVHDPKGAFVSILAGHNEPYRKAISFLQRFSVELVSQEHIVTCKFFLHVSKAEHKRRFFERLDTPDKNWKFSPGDVAERQRWNEYMRAYEEMVRATSTPEAPWHVVPADNKWFTRLVVASSIVAKLESLNLAYPEVSPDMRKQLKTARRTLNDE